MFGILIQADQMIPVGQYLLADSAYALSKTCIPSYKSPAANFPANKEFNYCIAKSRVRNEHTIGILKGRWASLQHLRLALASKKDMKHIIRWVNCCVILHNMLSDLGDAWEEIQANMEVTGPSESSGPTPPEANAFRNEVQEDCLKVNYNLGVLPIPGA